ncbi:hypothetical protein HOY34_00405 [Xinfangfangia sp. D13-10-4-6]|uniref:hypothetical protein n=1 Tax=Pseudogemmobacter hezensis TaxID=2737662 RepID=UPI001553247E|nr:hypothetical protein [Pseudogemmobacter hezensis]NPD13660.1 hypothetical protein [Pseudogemmobacter hezensis]
MKKMRNFFASATVMSMTALMAPGAALAGDAGVGVGLTWVFGSGPNGGLAAGAKIFTDRNKDSSGGSLGLDYHFSSSALRPNIGASYVGDGGYVDASFGYNIGTRNIDFGLGAGLVNSRD